MNFTSIFSGLKFFFFVSAQTLQSGTVGTESLNNSDR